jgi:TetR/AcrR family transcriptional regulator, transcriptional repressor for nem operon
MTMPTTERGRRSRERILDAAADLIHLKGVAGTSVDEVLARSGTGKSQFYHYFRDKDALVGAVLEHQSRRTVEELLPFLRELDSWEGIRRWFDAVLALQESSGFRGGCPIGSLAAETSESDEGFRARLDAALRLKGEYLREGLAAMARRGELRPEADPVRLATFVTAVLQGALLMASVEKRRDSLEAALGEAFDHLRSMSAKS